MNNNETKVKHCLQLLSVVYSSTMPSYSPLCYSWYFLSSSNCGTKSILVKIRDSKPSTHINGTSKDWKWAASFGSLEDPASVVLYSTSDSFFRAVMVSIRVHWECIELFQCWDDGYLTWKQNFRIKKLSQTFCSNSWSLGLDCLPFRYRNDIQRKW